MKQLYDEVASVQMTAGALSEAQQKDILNRALTQVEPARRKPLRMNWHKVWRIAAVAAALCCLTAVGVTAAGHFLRPSQVAEQMENDQLADLFSGENATEIGQTQQAGNYCVTLLGLTTGENVTGFWSSGWENGTPQEGRSYAVLAITRQDGTPMEPLSEDGGDVTLHNSLVSPVFASADCPLAQYNIFTMNGGRHDLVQDGTHYILVETDTLEPFADKDPQLTVILDTSASISALLNGYAQDPGTGAITAQQESEGELLLFDLPIDETKADPVRAESLRKQWFGEESQTADTDVPQVEEAMQALSTMKPEEVRAKGTLQSSETVSVTSGAYGRGWYFGDGGYLAYLDGWDNPEEDLVQMWSDDGQVELVTHHEDDTLTVEIWMVPVE